MKYLPLSEQEKLEKLKNLGLSSIDELFRSVPGTILKKTSDGLKPPMSEIEIRNLMASLPAADIIHNFLGGNGHTHYIPSVIDPIISRGEFLTSYTPYQPEISQGTLQAMFEYQSMMASLTGMEVSNASLYDGSTAMLEAILMSMRVAGKETTAVSKTIHREYLETLETYSATGVFQYSLIDADAEGKTNLSSVAEAVAKEPASIVIQSPNANGIIEEIKKIKEIIGTKKILLIAVITEAISLGLLKSPGELGADIVCGEAQSFGIPLSFGGPWLGFITTKEEYMRNLPGRLIGETKDLDGRRSYVITLAAREQHIRRAKATSNICTNQGLMALRASIYLSLMGKAGLRRAAERCHKFAVLAKELIEKKGLSIVYPESHFFNEFIIKTNKNTKDIFQSAMKYGIAPGNILSDSTMLCSFNETMSPDIIEQWSRIVTGELT